MKHYTQWSRTEIDSNPEAYVLAIRNEQSNTNVNTFIKWEVEANTSPDANYVYYLYDDNDLVVYVGMTYDPKKRWVAHRRAKKGSYMVVKESFDDRWLAREREAELIATLKPINNIASRIPKL